MAAVRVVLPWSMCPIVPTLTCGLVRVKVSLAIVTPALFGSLRLSLCGSGGTRPPSPRVNVIRSGVAQSRRRGPTAVELHSALGQHGPESCRWDLNPGPRPYQGRALPTEPRQRDSDFAIRFAIVDPVRIARHRVDPSDSRVRRTRPPGRGRERVMGIEPTLPAWKAGTLPLSYTRESVRSVPGASGRTEPRARRRPTRRSVAWCVL